MQEKSKEYNEKEQQVAENRSRNTLFERRENLQKHESYASERRQYDAIRNGQTDSCLLYTSPSPRDRQKSRMPSSA